MKIEKVETIVQFCERKLAEAKKSQNDAYCKKLEAETDLERATDRVAACQLRLDLQQAKYLAPVSSGDKFDEQV